jgi:hypothetical protein
MLIVESSRKKIDQKTLLCVKMAYEAHFSTLGIVNIRKLWLSPRTLSPDQPMEVDTLSCLTGLLHLAKILAHQSRFVGASVGVGVGEVLLEDFRVTDRVKVGVVLCFLCGETFLCC